MAVTPRHCAKITGLLRTYGQVRSFTLQIFHPILPIQYKIDTLSLVGLVAQRLEQRTHNPLVPGSNPGEPTNRPLYSPETSFTERS